MTNKLKKRDEHIKQVAKEVGISIKQATRAIESLERYEAEQRNQRRLRRLAKKEKLND